jgi:hypothetical protein
MCCRREPDKLRVAAGLLPFFPFLFFMCARFCSGLFRGGCEHGAVLDCVTWLMAVVFHSSIYLSIGPGGMGVVAGGLRLADIPKNWC